MLFLSLSFSLLFNFENLTAITSAVVHVVPTHYRTTFFVAPCHCMTSCMHQNLIIITVQLLLLNNYFCTITFLMSAIHMHQELILHCM